ncbi:sigma-54-dependent transcriptional regulator [Hydrogenophaga sp.]|uniref:sigma-54-dependent transcriptional regulator n=1 Tax=Hydrogenophaga sp. TaxID=1904254 RepID=UPI0039FB8A92
MRSQDALRRTLDEDFTVFTASSAEEAQGLLQRQPVSVILCDQRMPGTTGVVFLKEVREQWPNTVRILISGYTDSQDIIAGINEAGIYQYILKPWAPDALLESVRNAMEAQALQQQTSRLDLELRTSTRVLRQRTASQMARAQSTFGFDRIVRTPGGPLDQVCATAQRVARYDIPVLVLGESGTGKELLARAIHYASPRQSGPFVVENCAAIPDSLLESELFGHKRGAFTGAFEDHPGLFQRGNGGTVFLDEIGETSPAFQVKLLRVLQERTVRPLGSSQSIPVDVRILSATHRDLDAAMAEGQFRTDLYYRLNVVTLTLPPLSERREDIALLANHFLVKLAGKYGKRLSGFAPEAIKALNTAAWPGNVRQLYNVVEQVCALASTPLIPLTLIQRALRSPSVQVLTLAEARQRFEHEYLVGLLKLTDGNVADAARLADRNRTEFYRLLQKHSLTPGHFKTDLANAPSDPVAEERQGQTPDSKH